MALRLDNNLNRSSAKPQKQFSGRRTASAGPPATLAPSEVDLDSPRKLAGSFRRWSLVIGMSAPSWPGQFVSSLQEHLVQPLHFEQAADGLSRPPSAAAPVDPSEGEPDPPPWDPCLGPLGSLIFTFPYKGNLTFTLSSPGSRRGPLIFTLPLPYLIRGT